MNKFKVNNGNQDNFVILNKLLVKKSSIFIINLINLRI
jgi:hypothetical protein